MANVVCIVGLVVGVFAVICSVLALALPYWETADTAILEANRGLWNYCYKPLNREETCGDSADVENDDEFKDALRATRACVVLAMVCVVLSLVPVILMLFVMRDIRVFGFAGGAIAIAGGVFHMVCMALYIEKLHEDLFDYSAAFALNIMAWIVAWIAGALFFIAALQGGIGSAVQE